MLSHLHLQAIINRILGRPQIGRLLMVTVCAAILAMSVSVAGASASGLPEIEVNHMAEIEEWVYRDAAIKDPLPCGTTCTSLWNAEHNSLPQTAATQEMLDKFAALFLEKTHLWGSLTELRNALNEGGSFTLGASPIKVGWHIGSGEGSKWMELIGPTAPSESIGCGARAALKLTNEEIYKTSYSNPLAPGNEWYLIGCNGGTIVAEYANAENPSKPEEKCNKNSVNFKLAGWTRQEWQWNLCGEGFYEGKEVLAPIYAEGFYKNFHFGRIEDWTGQKLEGEFTRNVQTVGPSDPGRTATREAIEKILEESPAGRSWIQWVIEGEKGGDPLAKIPSEEFGPFGPLGPNGPGSPKCFSGKPVNCATGNEVKSQTDLTVGGRGPGLRMTRTYNAQLAAKQSAPGPFGYGWTGSYSAHVEVSEEQKVATIYQDDGSTVGFFRSGEKWVPANPLVQATLVSETGGYLYTLPNQTVLHFNTSGQLTSETDRNGNALTMTRNGEGRMESVSDPAGRKLVLAYNAEGRVESVTDPMGHVAKYSYESGSLASVTLPGEAAANWQFKYDSQHRLTSVTDGRGGKTTNEYDSENRVISQTDPVGRVLTFQYEPSRTRITNKTTGAVTDEHFSSDNEPVSITHGYGTAIASTREMSYDSAGRLVSVTDGNGHTTKYEYDSAGDRTKLTTPEGHETTWTYNATHDVMSATRPNGEKTTITRDEHGNATEISRPGPIPTVQTTKYTYDSHGDVETMTDPIGRIWKYEYDNAGDRMAEIDPETDKRTWGYNEDSQQTSTVSPRGNVTGGEPAKYTTSIERDAQGRPVKVTDPLGHETHYGYDADGNQASVKDANGHESKTTFDLANEPTKVTEPNGAIVETEYDGAGQVVAQIDGNKHATKYVRNVLEQVTEVVDPLLRKTTKTYDLAGNLATLTDAAKRTATYTYTKDNQLTKIVYSDGVTPTVEYGYDVDGNRTSMIDGTGKTTYTYDQLDRLTKTVDGHGNVVGYEYDLANEQTKITYPNGKTVEHGYDKAGRLHSLTDWLGHTTSFAYDQDSNLTATTFPTGTGEQDTYGYNEADQQTEVKMSKGAEVLASLTYTRDGNGQVTKTVSKGLPGAEITEYAYDENERLTKAGTSKYAYDAANNPTTIPGSTNTFDAADELTEGGGVKYAYDELGERTKMTPTSGPATTYGYDQAGNLTSITRPAEGTIKEIKDTFAYNGDGLRVSQTIGTQTGSIVLDQSTPIPTVLYDVTNSYIYGPGGVLVEQIDSTGKALFAHHDQQDSTRMLTDTTGTTQATATYEPYGKVSGYTGTATTPLRYDGEYTNADTGLIYLRARTYDPATAQFLSRDPLVALTLAPYGYSRDNPLNQSDPSGLLTGGICVSGEIALGIRVGGGVCGQVSSSGEIGASGTISGGVASGASASAGAGIQGSNAEHISELGGPFAHLGGSIHAGPGASADTFYGGDNPCGDRITGGEVSVGIGAGADQYGGASETGTIATGF